MDVTGAQVYCHAKKCNALMFFLYFLAFSVTVAKQYLCVFQLNDISAIQANLSQQHAVLTHLVKSGLPAVIADPDHDNRYVCQRNSHGYCKQLVQCAFQFKLNF